MARLRRLSLVAIIGLTAAAATPRRPIESIAVKGMRAIIFHGPMLETPIRITDPDEATWLYGALMKGLTMGEPYSEIATLKERPCIAIAVFRANSRPLVPGSYLVPNDGDLHYWFYPAIGNQPAVSPGRRLLNPAFVEELAAYGVPVKADHNASVNRCEIDRRNPKDD